MKTQRNILSASILTALGIGAFGAPAVAVDPGVYDLVVLTTPIYTTAKGKTSFNFGSDGVWTSSFTFGGTAPIAGTSQGMSDNGLLLTDGDGAGTASRAFGSSVAGDTFAGKLGITISGAGALTVTSFSKDTIPGTAGGNFAQEGGDLTKYSGAVNLATGSMTLATGDFASGLGRRGAIDSGSPGAPCGGTVASSIDAFCDTAWNKDDTGGVTSYFTFSTGSASGDANTINGAVLTSIGDVNGDFTTDYKAILVSGGDVGTAWDSFAGSDTFEVWSVQLRYLRGFATNDSVIATTDTDRVINVLTNDFGKASLSVTAVSTPVSGTATITGGGTTVTYHSIAAYTGPDTFTYTMMDGFGKTAVGTVNVTVTSGLVIADDDSANINQDVTTPINVAAGDTTSDPGAVIDPTSVVVGAMSAKFATLTSNPDGTVTYNPLPDFVGSDTFTYTIKDTLGNTSNVATVTVNVAAGPLTDQGTYSGTVLTAAQIGVPDPDVGKSCVGDCFSFTVTGVVGPTKIVLPPLGVPIASAESSRSTNESRYRKFNSGVWSDFNTSTGDSIASAPITANEGCPGPSDPSWKPWSGANATSANNLDVCIRLMIADGGVNDTDATANGSITDPGGVGQTTTNKTVSGSQSSFDKNAGGGCSLGADKTGPAGRADWWVLAAFIGMLGWLRRRVGKQACASLK